MTEICLHPSLINLPMPERLRRLPVTEQGFPKLFFAPVKDGKVILRSVDVDKFYRCIGERLCWLCGEPLDRLMTFVVSVTNAYTRVTYEPPCHYECAVYAMRACPFITNPEMRYRTAAWEHPGPYALYTTSYYTVGPARSSWPAALITMGIPERIDWTVPAASKE
jgi:hypothetical protein